MKPAKASHLPRKGQIILFTGSIIFLQLFFTWAILDNHQSQAQLRNQELSRDRVEKEIQRSALRNGLFYTEFAEALQFQKHDPELVKRLYKVGISKTPAGCKPYFSYVYYTSVQRGADIGPILQESLKRCGPNPEAYRNAGYFYIRKGQRDQGIRYFRRALELEPSSADESYRILDQGRQPMGLLIEITPLQPQPMLELALFLANKGKKAQAELIHTLHGLASLELGGLQSVIAAGLSLRAGRLDLASVFARRGLSFEETRAAALEHMARIAWEKQEREDSSRWAEMAEKVYLDRGRWEEAARTAVDAALRWPEPKHNEERKQALLRVAEQYPRYARAFYELAMSSRGVSNELVLFYLKQAAALDPDKYQKLIDQASTNNP